MHAPWGTRSLFVLGAIALLCSHVGAVPVTDLRSDRREDPGVFMEVVSVEETTEAEEELICTTCPTHDPVPLPPGPDLVILDYAKLIWLNSPDCICLPSYLFTFKIRNQGSKPSNPGHLRVRIYWGITQTFSVKSIPALTTQTWSVQFWNLPEYLYETYVQMDIYNQTVESNENNNARIFYFEP